MKDDKRPDGPLNEEEIKELEQIMAVQSKVAAETMNIVGTSASMRRSERVQVASRVLAAILVNDNYPLGDRLGTSEAVAMTDALLTRIDETEESDG